MKAIKKVNRTSRPNGQVNRPFTRIFSTFVGKYKNPRIAIQRLRREVIDENVPDLFSSLSNNQFFLSAVAPDRMPRRFGRLAGLGRLESRGLKSDLTWLSEVLICFAQQISEFLELEKSFDENYMAGKYLQCDEILDEVEKKFGLSIWVIGRKASIKRRLNVSGAEGYAKSLIASDPNPGLMPFLVYMLGFRADPNVTPAAYIRTIETNLSSPGMPAHIKRFLEYYTLSNSPASIEDAVAILSVGETLPVIDRYFILLDVIQFLISSKENFQANLSLLEDVTKRLGERIADFRLSILANIFGSVPSYPLIINSLTVEAADFYTVGEYHNAYNSILIELSSNPSRVELIPLLSRIYLRINPEVIHLKPSLVEVVKSFAAGYTFEDGIDPASSMLTREAISGVCRPLAACIRSLFASRILDPSIVTIEAKLEALNLRSLTPLHLRSLPSKDSLSLLEFAAKRFPSSTALKLQSAVASFGKSEINAHITSLLPADRSALYTARSLRSMGNTQEAILLISDLKNNHFRPTANDAQRELFNAYVSLGQIENALRIVADSYVENSRNHAMFDLKSLLDSIEHTSNGSPFSEIALSICYHVYNRFNNDERFGAQADAAEEYALSKGADLPSQIPFEHDDSDQKLTSTYLHQVCSPAILDKFMIVDNVDDVELERLEICRVLTEKDPGNRHIYLEEIREITRRRVVRARFEQVERTKIYVDTDGVRRQAEKTVRETYDRFLITLNDTSHSNKAIDMMKEIQSIIADVETEGVRIHFPDLPLNERDSLFESAVRTLTQMLISSQEYGLAAYLSTRVRHGTMGNQLRSAFEINSLLTQKDGGRYTADYGWGRDLSIEDFDIAHWLAQRLAEFSEAIDSEIEDLVRKKVQVYSESAPAGLFVFKLYNYDILRLQAKTNSDSTFDDFVESVVENFWSVLEDSLVSVREYINETFVTSVLTLTDQLQLDVSRELAGINLSLLSGAIASARTQIAVNTANVASWFTLAREMERPDYEYGIAVEVATASIAACHPSLGVRLQRTDQISFECRGKSLESLVYILFTAFDNALKHCGFTDVAPELVLSTTLSDGRLTLQLVNTCEPIPDFEGANTRLSVLKPRLQNSRDLQSLATTEGGSGYAKIIRILRHDLLSDHTIDFRYLDKSNYEVVIEMESRAIVK